MTLDQKDLAFRGDIVSEIEKPETSLASKFARDPTMIGSTAMSAVTALGLADGIISWRTFFANFIDHWQILINLAFFWLPFSVDRFIKSMYVIHLLFIVSSIRAARIVPPIYRTDALDFVKFLLFSLAFSTFALFASFFIDWDGGILSAFIFGIFLAIFFYGPIMVSVVTFSVIFSKRAKHNPAEVGVAFSLVSTLIFAAVISIVAVKW